jgi:hypothetical protein
MKGCLAVIGGVVVVFIILVIIAALNEPSVPPGLSKTNSSYASSDTSSSYSSQATDDCEKSSQHSDQAWSDIKADDYAGAYRNANTAVSLSDACNSGGDYDSTKAYALFARAIAEHHLTQGDSRTDLNQAITLYASCQADPGYYGTHAGAVCETAEQNAISWQTNWEMNDNE